MYSEYNLQDLCIVITVLSNTTGSSMHAMSAEACGASSVFDVEAFAGGT